MTVFINNGNLARIERDAIVEFKHDGQELEIPYQQFIDDNGGAAEVGDDVTIGGYDGTLIANPLARWYRDIEREVTLQEVVDGRTPPAAGPTCTIVRETIDTGNTGLILLEGTWPAGTTLALTYKTDGATGQDPGITFVYTFTTEASSSIGAIRYSFGFNSDGAAPTDLASAAGVDPGTVIFNIIGGSGATVGSIENPVVTTP